MAEEPQQPTEPQAQTGVLTPGTQANPPWVYSPAVAQNTENTPGPVPYARFAEVNRQLGELRQWKESQEKAQKDAQAKQLAESGQWQKLHEEAQKKLADFEAAQAVRDREQQERIVQYEVMLAATKPEIGIVDPEAAVKLLDWSALQFGDDGKPNNVSKLLTDLVKAKPYLKGPVAGPPDVNARTGGGKETLDEARKQVLAATYGVKAQYIK